MPKARSTHADTTALPLPQTYEGALAELEQAQRRGDDFSKLYGHN